MKSLASLVRISILTFAVLCLFASKAFSQWDTLPWKSYADYKLQLLNKNYVTTGILYDRVFPIANVDEYTGLTGDTTTPNHFMQAYYEIYNAAFNTTDWKSPDQLDNLVRTNDNEHPVGVFLYKFNSMDTNALQDHLVDTLPNGQFVDVAGRPRTPYFTHSSFLATPLLAEGQTLDAGQHFFYIDPQFFLHNENVTITQIRIDFGDGQGEWVVDNPFSSGSQQRMSIASITKMISGNLVGRIVVTGFDLLGYAIFHSNPFQITVRNPKPPQELTECKGGGQQWVVEAEPAALAQVNAQYAQYNVPILQPTRLVRTGPNLFDVQSVPVRDTAFFFFASGSCGNRIVRRPVVFIDGFDPTNSRSVREIYRDYINKQVSRNGNAATLFGDYMQDNGNGDPSDDIDLIILDFKHGNDLLERNALTLVALLQRLNQTYGANYLQDITLIGPSMGSLIAQYALAYMEQNSIPHRVKTYISFDGCHQGANVPIGLQYFVEYFTKKGILKKNELIREGMYNGLAARQMLAHHHSASSQFPAPDVLRTQFLQNLAAVGEYPQQCRKVAIINGTNKGNINYNFVDPNQRLLRIYTQRKGWKSIWGACTDKICMKLDWECSTAPRAFGAQKVAEMYTVEPIFNLLFWVPLGQKNYYAEPAWGNSSLDDAPGGMFGKLFGEEDNGQIIESKFKFLLKEAMYLLTGSKRTQFYQHVNDFTMMPSYSAADLRFANKNLYLKWDDQYLCGKTPFDYVYAPEQNEQHVSITQTSSWWFENEIRCQVNDLPIYIDPNIVGNPVVCTSEDFEVPTCKPTSSVPNWSVTPSGIASLTVIGNKVRLTKIKSGFVTLAATMFNCSPVTVSKTITIGSPAPQSVRIIMVDPTIGRIQAETDPVPGATSYRWYKDGVMLTSYTGTFAQIPITRNKCGVYYNIGVVANNSCGASTQTYTTVYIPPCGAYVMSPNPASNSLIIEDAKEGDVGAQEISNRGSIRQIKVEDKMGNVLKQLNYATPLRKVTIDITDLKVDMYFVKIYDGKQWTTKQLSVIRD